MSSVHLWLRAEVKPNEHRTALTPASCNELIQAGFKITIERFPERCAPDAEFVAAGCEIAETGTWRTAPADAFIVGLKELPENDDSPLTHRHIFFGHCFKNQGGWKELLTRFHVGKGTLLDMEFLTNDSGRRVAAFGYMAGYAGAFAGVDVWCQQQLAPGTPLGAMKPYANDDEMIAYAKKRLAESVAKSGKPPRALVMGALGRCGTGATDLLAKIGIPSENVTKWDMAETKAGGPFPAILEHEVFINCIYLSKPIPPFVTREMLDTEGRALSVVVDVSCDTSNPHNPLPFVNVGTTFDSPTFSVDAANTAVDVVAIDHLPTLLPLESSERYAADLLPTFKTLPAIATDAVWQRAIKLFQEKLAASQA